MPVFPRCLYIGVPAAFFFKPVPCRSYDEHDLRRHWWCWVECFTEEALQSDSSREALHRYQHERDLALSLLAPQHRTGTLASLSPEHRSFVFGYSVRTPRAVRAIVTRRLSRKIHDNKNANASPLGGHSHGRWRLVPNDAGNRHWFNRRAARVDSWGHIPIDSVDPVQVLQRIFNENRESRRPPPFGWWEPN